MGLNGLRETIRPAYERMVGVRTVEDDSCVSP